MNDLVVLVHGFFTSRKSMEFLHNNLSRKDYEVLSVDLPTTFSSLTECVTQFHAQMVPVVFSHSRVHFVGHSMGGLIIRKYLEQSKLANMGNCIFIATPHHGTRIANILHGVPFVSKIFRPISDLTTHMAYPNSHFGAQTKIGLIVGTNNGLLGGKILLSNQSDGRVELESAICFEDHELLKLPFHHKVIHKQQEALFQVESFLRSGRFMRQSTS